MSCVPCITNNGATPIFALAGAGGGGGSSVTTSTIGSPLTGNSTMTFVYTGKSSGQALTDTILFEGGHKYNLTFNCTVGSLGDFTPLDTIGAVGSFAQFGGGWYSPIAGVTGQNTDDNALLTASMWITPITTFSTGIGVFCVSPGNTSSISTIVMPGLAGSYSITLTDFGVISE
jgi:hypothetical protein